MLSSLVGPRYRPEKLAEMEMAVRDERPHVELVGQSQRIPVVRLCPVDIAPITARSDFAEQAETPGLVASLLVVLCEGQGLESIARRIIEAPLDQAGFAEPRHLHRATHAHRAHGPRRAHDFLEKAPALLRAPRECQRVSETPEHGPGLKLPGFDDSSRSLQGFDGCVVLTPGERHGAQACQGLTERKRMICALRDSERLQG